MRIILLIALVVIACNSQAQTILLKDDECVVIGSIIGGPKINVSSGDLSKSVCVKISEEVSCSYTFALGNPVNEGTKFKIIYDDNKSFGFWDGKNEILILDYQKLRYNYAMIGISVKHGGVMLNKYCIGSILEH